MAKFHFKPFSSLLLLLKLLATNCQKILPEKFCKRLMDGAGYWKVVGTYLTSLHSILQKSIFPLGTTYLMSLALYEGRRVGKLNWLLCCAHWMFRSVKDFLDHEPIGIRFDLIGLYLPILCTYLKNVSAWAENISKKLTYYYFVSKKEILPTYALFSNPAFSILFHAWCNVSCKTKSVNSLENQFICK